MAQSSPLRKAAYTVHCMLAWETEEETARDGGAEASLSVFGEMS